MSNEEIREAIYQACLAAFKEIGIEEVKKMSWFGKNKK